MPENEIVIYRRGKEVTKAPKRLPPELLQIIMLDDLQVALTKLNKHWEKTEFQGGLIDERNLEVTDRVQSMTFIYSCTTAQIVRTPAGSNGAGGNGGAVILTPT
ncbi:unnamed protein product [marine sediment metagenome]|uniref:Uncharacterized protein n=1 Tax=marine sediment metagenome TaxID=412755 RepID=X1RPJ2_9ZZZZ